MDIKQNMQFAYDSLINLANGAYENYQTYLDTDSEFSKVWLAKSDAYEWGAHMMNSAMMASGIFLNSRETSRQKDKEEKVVGKKEVA